MMKDKNLCVIQARLGSTRLPKKVLMKVNGLPLLEYLIRRVKQAKKLNKIVIATTKKREDDKLEMLCKKVGLDCFRGSEDDVLDRYYQCSLRYPDYQNIVRITGDGPLIDPAVIDRVIWVFEKDDYDYVSNTINPTFPDGLDIEIFKKEILSEAVKKAKLPSEREHVTPYIRKMKKFKKFNVENEVDFSHIRLSVDHKEDLEVVRFLIKNSKISDGYLDYISLLTKNPKIMLKNFHLIRNEGLLKSLREDKIYENKVY